MCRFRQMSRSWFALIIALLLLGIGLGVSTYCGFFSRAESLNIFLIAALVLVTAVYAKESERARKATEDLARATKEMAQTSVMPVLVADVWVKSTSVVDVQTSSISVSLRNIGPGSALDIGASVVDARPEAVEKAWKDGKTAGISFLHQFNLPELASSEDMTSNPKDIDLALTKGMKFVLVTECSDVHRNDIGAYREFQVLEGEQGKLFLKVTQTISAQKIGFRIRSYP